tara:strand:+ start:68 stop:802 length:735 start_codon:yes stop_codon:yes gene_type:complete
VCADPATAATLAVSTASSVASYATQTSATKSKNRSRIRAYEAEKQNYLNDIMLRNNQYNNEVIEQELALDELNKAQMAQWANQDRQYLKLLEDHAFNTQDALVDRYRKEYAGPQTGVTASRLAGETARAVGLGLSKSIANVMFNKETIALNKEIIYQDTDAKRRLAYEKVRYAPLPGAPPPPPELEAPPGIGGMLLNIAMAGAQAKLNDKLLNKQKFGTTNPKQNPNPNPRPGSTYRHPGYVGE